MAVVPFGQLRFETRAPNGDTETYELAEYAE
jgi:hypothetical protein